MAPFAGLKVDMTARDFFGSKLLAVLTVMAFLPAVHAQSTQASALAAARARWRAAGLSSYEYGYRKFCECHPDTPPETVVSVRDDAVTNVRHRPVGYPQEVPGDPTRFKYYWTIDGLFDLLQAAEGRGATVRASYDAKLGYPTQIYIDYDANFIGDELDVRLTAVTPLTPH